MACYRASAVTASLRDFVVVDYDLTAWGEFVPRRPAQCLRRGAKGDRCRLVVNHWRERATLGVGRLLVLECRTHGVSFTVYPRTVAPYQRAPTLAATPDGHETAPSAEGGESPGLQGTLFEAAEEAREGGKWHSREPASRKEVDAPEPGVLRWRASRLRQLERAEDLLGLSAELDDTARVERASVLGVEAVQLKQVSATASQGTLGQRGGAVCELLEAMPRSASSAPGCRLERLLWAGYQAGLWGRPWIWETSAAGWRPALFPAGGPGLPTQSRTAPQPPTSMLVDGQEGLV